MEATLPLLWLDRQAPLSGWGPGARAVIWLPAQVTAVGAHAGTAGELADWVCTQVAVEGLTLTGGEPLAQSRGLVNLVRLVADRRPELSFICHTHFELERLEAENHAWRRVLLESIDVLVHGLGSDPRDPFWGMLDGQSITVLGKHYRELVEVRE
jgi:anaerobic ribonucleoside-triphosphate reductase activating protein